MSEFTEHHLGLDGQDVIDPLGIWEYLCQTFRSCTATETTLHERMQLIMQLQRQYNKCYLDTGLTDGQVCTGYRRKKDKHGVEIDYDKVKDYRHQCNSPLCPSCWSYAQKKCLSYILEAAPKYKHLYYRETSYMDCQGPTHPEVVKRFRCTNTQYRLIAWCTSFNKDDDDVVQFGPGRYDKHITVNPMTYKLMGVFGSMKPIRERGPLVRRWTVDPATYVKRTSRLERDTNVYDPETGDVLVSMSRYELSDATEAIDMWFDKMIHPMVACKDSYFTEAIVWAKETLGRYSFRTGSA